MSREGIKCKSWMEIVLEIPNGLTKGGVTINNKAIDKWGHLLEYTT